MSPHFPSLLFAVVGLLCVLLGIFEWNARRRRLALLAGAVAAIATLCLATNIAWARYAVRIDLLITIPLVSLGALILGVLALVRPPVSARLVGASLAGGAAMALLWYLWSIAPAAVVTKQAIASLDEGRQLYWDETIRCQGNFEKRFGPLHRGHGSCFGNLVVNSQNPGTLSVTRLVVNDEARIYLLSSPRAGVENSGGQDEAPFATLRQSDDGALDGQGEAEFGVTRLKLKPVGDGACEATITRYGTRSILRLKRQELPRCDSLPSPPVRYLGDWGKIIAADGTPPMRRLLQLWLWDTSGEVRGLLLSDLAPARMRRDFVFLRHLRGERRDANQWELRLEDGSRWHSTVLELALLGSRARLTGPANIVGFAGAAMLDRGEVVSHPRIALVPVRDRRLFGRYMDNALFNLNVPWTAP